VNIILVRVEIRNYLLMQEAQSEFADIGGAIKILEIVARAQIVKLLSLGY
jgi:hypothetical protein